MKRRLGKKVSVLIIAILIISSLATAVYAVGQRQNLSAFFNNIKIYRNNKQVQLNLAEGMHEPFIVNGYTYVPLRAISDIFDKDIAWDGTNYRIDINDKAGQPSADDISYLMNIITEKQNEINTLQAKVTELEKQLEDQKDKSISVRDLENDLNKKFDEFEDIEFEIDLVGNKDEIDVRIYVDLDDYWTEWKSLKKSEKEEYIEDIVDYIQDYYEDADITGFIEDDSIREKLIDFYINSRGKLVIGHDPIDDVDAEIEDLEDFLNDKYDTFKGQELNISLYGDERDIEIEVDVEDWYDLSDDNQIKLLEGIYDYIIDDFPDAKIYGSVYDKYEQEYIDFDFDRWGYVDF